MFDINSVYGWAKDNQIILGLLASAIVITMPETLPHWRQFPEWMWEWTRDAMKTFLNFRHSGVPITDTQHAQEKMVTQQAAQVVVKKPVDVPQQLNG